MVSERRKEFEEVALPHLERLYGMVLALTRNRAEAEDLVQETYLWAYRAFDQFTPGTNCRAWLFTILRHHFLNRLKKSSREVLEWDVLHRRRKGMMKAALRVATLLAVLLALTASPGFAQGKAATAANPCAVKPAANPCAAQNPCAAKNPCGAKK